jgi:hypothetical protein
MEDGNYYTYLGMDEFGSHKFQLITIKKGRDTDQGCLLRYPGTLPKALDYIHNDGYKKIQF